MSIIKTNLQCFNDFPNLNFFVAFVRPKQASKDIFHEEYTLELSLAIVFSFHSFLNCSEQTEIYHDLVNHINTLNSNIHNFRK